jgi:hypothetical protein
VSYGFLNSGDVFSQSHKLRRRGTIYCFDMDRCCLCLDNIVVD